MRIDSNGIIERRTRRAWSQQHLADAANISLRTVQRIERHGQGSPESLMAIAASLDTTPDALSEKPLRPRSTVLFALAATALLVLVASIPAVMAEPLMLRVAISQPQEGAERSPDRVVHLLADDGDARELILSPFLLKLVPATQDNRKVLISVSIQEETQAGTVQWASEPSVLTESGQPAVIELVDSNQQTLTLELTPNP